ncbi:MAG: Alpha/Beta hydrolase protein [Monoraphidium minutum]|nr:MAG: Alpha/Beta hydrolase protein [Monoraphidium minutum]
MGKHVWAVDSAAARLTDAAKTGSNGGADAPGGGATTTAAAQQPQRGAAAAPGGAQAQQAQGEWFAESVESADGGEGPAGAPVFHEGHYEWRWGSRIRYYSAGDSGPPLLLVHGFGVGGYHFDRNFAQLSRHFRVFALDLLGQGGSWPADTAVGPDPELGPLMYSADVWTLQLQEFLTSIAGAGPGCPAYVAGNSLGGYLAVNLAGSRPDLVKGLVMLNATPFWSFRTPGQALGLMEGIGLDGTVPVPKTVKTLIERLWWRSLSSPTTVESLLSLVYAGPINDARLLARILEATEHPGAIDAFASIVLSPKTARSFDENLAALSCPVLLCYGRDDPWVVPIWGQRFKRAVPHAAYYELSDVGHCPHHEAPNAVNHVLTNWIHAVETRLASLGSSSGADAAAISSGGGGGGGGEVGSSSGGGDPLLVDGPLRVGESLRIAEARGSEVVVSHVAGAPRNVFERADAAVFAAGRWLRAMLG